MDLLKDDWDETSTDPAQRFVHDTWLNDVADGVNGANLRAELRTPVLSQLTLPRLGLVDTTMATGDVTLTYFVAEDDLVAGHVAMQSGGTAAATITLGKIGLYSVATNGNLTKIGTTASTTTLFAATGTKYETALSVVTALTQGSLYALALLMVGTTMPTVLGTPAAIDALAAPRLCALRTGQSDLPSSILSTDLVVSPRAQYARLFV